MIEKERYNFYLTILISIVAAISIIAAAYFLQDTRYENLWLYLSGIWVVVFSFVDIYCRKKRCSS